jgi:tRNA dimethylallyltransferase
MDDERLFLPVVAGPTASGKTALAVQLAKRINGEVVSADSMQIYYNLQIGTARPDEQEMMGIPHHLMGFLPLSERYSVAHYVEDARRAISEIYSRGKQPLMCGGTGLYIDAVVDNLRFSDEQGNPEFREHLRKRAEKEGAEVLLEELRVIDPQTAQKLHPNNLGRIIRALELYRNTGITMSEQIRRSRQKQSPYKHCIIVLDCRNREFLYDRINRRVDDMMKAGLLEEARYVVSLPVAPTAKQAIGYKEFVPYFEGAISLEQAVNNLKQATRRYAKRQLSWFRRRRDAHFIFIDDYSNTNDLADAAAAILEECIDG